MDAASGTAARRHRGRVAPYLNRAVDLLRVNSALCTGAGCARCPR
ncbi:hypothetical protein [Streptacidiphilus monticola]|uniref:Uncharacterized protein n=1 Tax=Streptacidiphilus monticola TaxID=2161674 RepID=A0ABW1FZB8_9ACTN